MRRTDIPSRRPSFRPAWLAAAAAAWLAAGCVFVPRTTLVYDEDCHIEAREMVLEMQQVGAFVGCRGEGCAAILAGAGVVAAASAVVSGSIVIAGNIVYWFEKQGACQRRPEPPEPLVVPELPPAPETQGD
ncbi:MAG: hypothetical protein KDG55_03450 [Rhodocyclaceae bacterium]|nr:hypothetical protein [Rhodocyclaceae bacterium]